MLVIFATLVGFGVGFMAGCWCVPPKVAPKKEQWLTTAVECFICTYRWQAVCEEGTDLRRLECPACHSQDSAQVGD